MTCPCGKEPSVQSSPLCREHWQLIPAALKYAYSAAQRDLDSVAAERLTKAVRDYTDLTLAIQTTGQLLATDHGRNQYRREKLNAEINRQEAQQRDILKRSIAGSAVGKAGGSPASTKEAA